METIELLIKIWPVAVSIVGLFMTIGVLIFMVRRTDKLLFKADGSLAIAKADDVKEAFKDMEKTIWKDHKSACKINSSEIASAVQAKMEETQIDMASKIAEILEKKLNNK